MNRELQEHCVDINTDGYSCNHMEPKQTINEVYLPLNQVLGEATCNSSSIDKSNMNREDKEKSKSHVDVVKSHAEVKTSRLETKNAKEVLLIDVYGVENPKTDYNATTVPMDRPRELQTRQTRRFRNRTQAFFMRSQEDGDGLDYANDDPDTRNYFIRKVFAIVFVMLVLTAGFVALAYNTEPLRGFFSDPSIKFALLGAMVVLMFVSCIVPSDCARVPPCNYICLVIGVLCMSFIAAAICCRYEAIAVLIALIVTALIVLMCFGLACTKFDFTQFLLYIMAAFAVLALCSITYMILRMCGIHVPVMHMIILIIGALLQTVMIIIELQMILGGRAVQLSEDDYALGAFMLYTSIMQLFLNLLQLIAQFN